MKKPTVVIIGAGPTGLMLALCLAKFGIGVEIFEKEKTIPKTSRALAIHTRTLEILENLGVVKEFLRQGKRIHEISVFSLKRKIFSLDISDNSSEYPFVLILPQNMTQKILLDAAVKAGAVVHWKEEVREFKDTTDAVSITIKPVEGKRYKMKADFLIDCGGAHSLVRHALAIPFRGKTYEHEDFILADATLSWKRSSQFFHAFLSQKGVMAAIPLPGDAWRILAEFHLGKNQSPPQLQPQLFENLLKERSGDEKVKISNITWMSHFRINKRMVTTYRIKNVFLAGDAAHIHSPVGGQGMNTGMQDAYNLAWKMAFVLRHQANESLLDTYEKERVGVARSVLGLTDFSTNIIVSQNFLSRFIRERVIGFFISQQFVQRKIATELSELTVSYRNSTLSHIIGSTSSGKLSPGDRAPGGTLMQKGKTVSLYSLLPYKKFTGLYFLSETKELENLLKKVKKIEKNFNEVLSIFIIVRKGETAFNDRHVLKAEAQFFEQYDITSDLFFLIRPDGYITLIKAELTQEILQSFFSSPLFKFI